MLLLPTSRLSSSWIQLVILLHVFASELPATAAEQKYWELSSYRVQIHIAVDDSQMPQPQLGLRLVEQLKRKIRSTIYPLWITELTLDSGAEKQKLLSHISLPEELLNSSFDLEQLNSAKEKQLFLTVTTGPMGYELASREFDCSTNRWGALQQRTVRQDWMLSTQSFELLCQTFSPLATIRPLADNDKEILLKFRGSELPQQADLSFLRVAGQAFQPLMVRTNASGEISTDDIREIPWTYLTLGELQEDGWHGIVHTGTRRPFGVRRRGRIEHLALAIKRPTGRTKVRFYARHDQSQGLTGYEVFRREPSEKNTTPMGLTDSNGSVAVNPGKSKVAILFLRSDGQLLAKVPVVAGAKRQIEVPIADDTARLRAQAALTSLTERLIDTVAQRNILIARVRDRIENGKLDQAQELFTVLDNLPGRADFARDIKSAENRKLNQSADAKVQARIEKLFADTRKLLARFLNTKQITQLQGELTAARRNGAG